MEKRKIKPVWKWVIGIFAGLLFLSISAGWYLTWRWKPILDKQLKEAVLSATDSLYRVDYDDISINILTGSLNLHNFRLISDSLVYQEMEEALNAPDNRFDVNVSQVRIRGFNISKAIFSDRVAINQILVDTPEVYIRNKYQFYNDTISSSKPSDQRLLGSLKELKIQHIGIKGIDFTFDRELDSVRSTYNFENVSVDIKDILIDSTSIAESERFYYTGSLELKMGSYEWDIQESPYQLAFDSLRVRTDTRQITIEGLRYTPNMSRNAFYQYMGYAKDMIELHFTQVNLMDVDLDKFSRSQRIHAGSLHLSEGAVHVSNDRRYPRRPVNKIGQSPHQQLMRIGQPLKIDTLHVDNVDISYSEISEKYHKEGDITFERTSGWIANVTNDSVSLSQNQIATADLTTYVQNQGKLNVQFTFDMLDERGAYTYKGTLGAMNGKAFNRILTPLLSAEVGTANIQELRFDMQGNDYRNWGTLWWDYSDMRVYLLDTHEDGSTSRKKIISFLANELLINDSNPDSKGVYIIGKIDYQRPHEFSFYKTLWKSLLEGIKQTAGISRERESRLINTAESAKTIREKSGTVLNSLFRKREPTPDNKEQ